MIFVIRRRTDQRVSAIFRVEGKYVLRQVCENGLKALKAEGELYSFPGATRYVGESERGAAIRAAEKWGFSVKPAVIIRGNDKTYVVCEGAEQKGNPMEHERLLLQTYDELMQDSRVSSSVKEFLTKNLSAT